ncbi:hypothetical protein [Bacillus thuringiensis]|uniref:hypothetical protein n=1 Tax=Bacillus thuringiensis TaxID=1428 RepID=UPI003F6BF358
MIKKSFISHLEDERLFCFWMINNAERGISIVEEGEGTFTNSDFVEKVAGLYKKDVAKVIEFRKEQIKKSP